MAIWDMAHNVRTREDLLAFIEALANDYEHEAQKDAWLNDWANGDIPSFLRAIVGFADSPENLEPREYWASTFEPSWRLFAELLIGGRDHE